MKWHSNYIRQQLLDDRSSLIPSLAHLLNGLGFNGEGLSDVWGAEGTVPPPKKKLGGGQTRYYPPQYLENVITSLAWAPSPNLGLATSLLGQSRNRISHFLFIFSQSTASIMHFRHLSTCDLEVNFDIWPRPSKLTSCKISNSFVCLTVVMSNM